MSDVLPFDFDQIVKYGNMDRVESNFTGFTYNTKTQKIGINISNLNNINSLDDNELLMKKLDKTFKQTDKISKLVNDVSNLKKQTEELVNKQNEDFHNANEKPIVAGVSKSTGIDYKGIYTQESSNPNRMIRMQDGKIGISTNGTNDFEPIITPDGINPKFLPIIHANIDKGETIATLKDGGSSSSGGNNGGSSSGTGNTTINNTTNITNPKIKYIDLPCKLIRDEVTKKVKQIEYYKDNVLEYLETIIRDDTTNKVIQATLEHIGKETEITTLTRDSNGKVTNINVVYINEDLTLEYAGMK
jgi:hypothetical protein